MTTRSTMIRSLVIAIVLVMFALPGCAKRLTPVNESDWRNHLSQPSSRISRNWALPDNTMLAELGCPSSDRTDVITAYAYEVFDPRTNSATTVVPMREHPLIRYICDSAVEFICDGGIGLPYLVTYDIATRKATPRIPSYPASAPRQLGLTNGYTRLKSVQTEGVGIRMSLEYAGMVPFMRISGDERSKTLEVQLPGLAAPDSALQETSLATGLIESVSVKAGVRSRFGGQALGTTIRIKTRASDWGELTYAIVATRPGLAEEFTVQVSESSHPADLSQLLDLPANWSNWRLRIEQGEYPIESTIELRDGTVLAKYKGAQTWVLCDPKSCLFGFVVGEGDGPILSRVTDREVQFLCQGMTQQAFPYLMVYDVETRTAMRRQIHAAVEAPVEFGSSHSFIFAGCTPANEGLALGVREGPIMAGGGEPPATRTWADKDSHAFYVEFPGTVADKLSFGPIDPRGIPFVESIQLIDGVRGADGGAAPGATLQLVLDAEGWNSLTYNIGYNVDEHGNPGPGLILTLSDSEPATDLTALQSLPR